MVHSHTVHLPRGVLLTWCTVCGYRSCVWRRSTPPTRVPRGGCGAWEMRSAHIGVLAPTLTQALALALTLAPALTLPTYQAGEVEFKANKEGLVHGAVRKSRGVGYRGGVGCWACARRGAQE